MPALIMTVIIYIFSLQLLDRLCQDPLAFEVSLVIPLSLENHGLPLSQRAFPLTHTLSTCVQNASMTMQACVCKRVAGLSSFVVHGGKHVEDGLPSHRGQREDPEIWDEWMRQVTVLGSHFQ